MFNPDWSWGGEGGGGGAPTRLRSCLLLTGRATLGRVTLQGSNWAAFLARIQMQMLLALWYSGGSQLEPLEVDPLCNLRHQSTFSGVPAGPTSRLLLSLVEKINENPIIQPKLLWWQFPLSLLAKPRSL